MFACFTDSVGLLERILLLITRLKMLFRSKTVFLKHKHVNEIENISKFFKIVQLIIQSSRSTFTSETLDIES